MLPFSEVNILAVLVSAVAFMIIGAIWYGPVFGKKWIKLVNLNMKEAQKSMGKTMLMGFIQAFLTAYSLALILSIANPENLKDALLVGAIVWFGFAAMNEFSSAIWAKTSWELACINSAQILVSTLTSVAILTSWPA